MAQDVQVCLSALHVWKCCPAHVEILTLPDYTVPEGLQCKHSAAITLMDSATVCILIEKGGTSRPKC